MLGTVEMLIATTPWWGVAQLPVALRINSQLDVTSSTKRSPTQNDSSRNANNEKWRGLSRRGH